MVMARSALWFRKARHRLVTGKTENQPFDRQLAPNIHIKNLIVLPPGPGRGCMLRRT